MLAIWGSVKKREKGISANNWWEEEGKKKKSQKTANITNIIKNIYINPYYYWVLGLS